MSSDGEASQKSPQIEFFSDFTIYFFKFSSSFLKFFIVPILFLCITTYVLIAVIYIFTPTNGRYEFIIDENASYSELILNSLRRYSDSFFSSEINVDDMRPLDAASAWVRSCQRPIPTFVVEGGQNPISVSALTSSTPLSMVSAQARRLNQQVTDSRQDLVDLRTRTYIFLTLSAVIGFLTTVVAASNAWNKFENVLGSSLKLLGVLLPALGTLITALASIYAPVDTISRKSQLVSALINTEGELGAILAATTCDKVKSSDPTFTRDFTDWNKRFLAAIAAAEFSQGTANSENQKTVNSQKTSVLETSTGGTGAVNPIGTTISNGSANGASVISDK